MSAFTEGGIRIQFPDDLSVRKFDDPQTHRRSHMRAVDFIVDLPDRFLFIEVKEPEDKSSLKNMRGLSRKFRDSFLYEWAEGRAGKRIDYIVLLVLGGRTHARRFDVASGSIAGVPARVGAGGPPVEASAGNRLRGDGPCQLELSQVDEKIPRRPRLLIIRAAGSLREWRWWAPARLRPPLRGGSRNFSGGRNGLFAASKLRSGAMEVCARSVAERAGRRLNLRPEQVHPRERRGGRFGAYRKRNTIGQLTTNPTEPYSPPSRPTIQPFSASPRIANSSVMRAR